MANYDSIASIAVIYEGTVSSFNSITDKSAYYGSIVFITGSTASNAAAVDKQQAIWVSQDNGSNAHFLNMSDTNTIAKALSYVKGVIVDGKEYIAAAGGASLTLVGDEGITIIVDEESGAITFNTQGLRTMVGQTITAANAAVTTANSARDAVSGLRGGDATGTVRDIAEDVAGEVSDSLLGDDGDSANDDTIKGVKNTVRTITSYLYGENVTPTDKTKILASVLPDVILGQLKFGGTIGNKNTSILDQQLVLKPSSLYKSEFITAADSINIDPTKFLAKDREGWYFIVASPNGTGIGNFGWDPYTSPTGTVLYRESYDVGDWFLSTGVDWEKIDNTDAVVGVAGLHGDISTADLVTKLSTATTDTNKDPLAKKSDISLKSVAVANNSTEYISITTDTEAKKATISVDTASMLDVISSDKHGNDALATANDVFNFIKARLSIKVVSSN